MHCMNICELISFVNPISYVFTIVCPLQQAIIIFDHKVCDTIKRTNALNHVTVKKQKRLEELQTKYNQMVKDSEEAVKTDKGDSEEAQQMRYLENSYDKVCMKNEEAKQVQRVYLDIKSRFEQVRLCVTALTGKNLLIQRILHIFVFRHP